MNEEEFQELLRYQNSLARIVVQEAKTDRKIKLLNIANRLTKNGKTRVQTEAFIQDAEMNGFSEEEAYGLLEELERDGLIREAEEGFLKRT